MTRIHTPSLPLAGRLLLAAALITGALYLGPRPATATLNPTCVQHCSTNSTQCVQNCKGNSSCVKECRTIFDTCLSHCQE